MTILVRPLIGLPAGVQLGSLDPQTAGIDEIAVLVDAELSGAAEKRSALGFAQNEQPLALNRQIGGAVGGLHAALDKKPVGSRQARSQTDLGAADIGAQEIEKHRAARFETDRIGVGDVVTDDIHRVTVAVDAADAREQCSC